MARCGGHPDLEDADRLVKVMSFDQAVPICAAITRERPELLRAWIDLGRCHNGLGRPSDAIDVRRRAEVFHPQSPLVAYNIACYHALLGDGHEAVRRLIQAMAIDTHFRDLARRDPDFNAIRESVGFKAALEEPDPVQPCE